MKKESPLMRLHSFDQGHGWVALLHLLIYISPAVTGQPLTPPVEPDNSKSVVTIMAIVVIMFFISAFFSLYSRKCSDRQSQPNGIIDTGAAGNQLQTEPNGLNQATIETFPVFLYSDVKSLKIGKGTLACAVCLNEFEDDETLRMIPKCCHVYHLDCVDVWLASHPTCPLCRANLVPEPQDTNMNMNMPPIMSIQIPDEEEREHEHEHEHEHEYEHEYGSAVNEEHKRDSDLESPKVDLLRGVHTLHHSRPSRSRSTGFLSWSNSMGQLGENNYERFTLRLPEQVRTQMVNSTLKRANSCVCFTRMSSGTWGYRTRSLGSGRGRGSVQYERFNGEEQWGFTLTSPSLIRNGWNRSTRKSPVN
ncbi:hypothetical protein VNO78_31060 [Psophocarpus tetragonolobus]|uniref:RING-type E3 ubiquitin transferase n=1 Tax=Psophocarpus tetragonolobus TaxID=3891 RepID=A0AAN9RZ77_PSOTE